MRGRKKILKKWKPDPTLALLLRPFYEKGIPAYIAAELLLRNKDGEIIKNPNVKTYFKYWKFWRQEYNESKRKEHIREIKIRQEYFERKYIIEYDKIILVLYEIEQTLEGCREFKTEFDSAIPKIDLSLEKMILRTTKLWGKIIYSRYTTENDIIIFRINKRKIEKSLRNLARNTHMLLLSVVNFLAKRTSRKAVLDCQIKEKTTESIVIKCGICHGALLIHCNL